ncbi:MAG: bifunctional phosphopantothenoylcysteine decarboxylase/phosphopantothenate--cysteine ligase CoaBC [Wigglesworthia glossinidia]|nr:bifunctional phosphopantothenoylcysteine decarboxylase/phosphopantothenate--cysteine ligase CoaBC [Wigglesworthia glossinidia]
MQMKELINKNILLGISGSISAYKSLDLIRKLREKGANVRVIMTKSAQSLITPLSVAILSKNDVITDDNSNKNCIINHIEISKWPNLIIIAPATANIIAKLSSGISDSILSSICLATTSQIAISPAMNTNMYSACATQENLKKLNNRGVLCWGPECGIQACGDYGFGRMLKISELIILITKYFKYKNFNKNSLKILITAGPTREPIDPVRFISNQSSGKMGFAIAQAAIERGAKVTLISGPVNLPTPIGTFQRIKIINALDMYKKVMLFIKNQDIFICCAAITDYRLKHTSLEKIKKKNNKKLILKFIKNPDLLSEVSALEYNKRPYIVGFSADTENIQTNAQEKRIRKNIDLICANDISTPNQGFNSDYNSLHLFWKTGNMFLSINNKLSLAKKLLNQILLCYEKKNKY